jgi:arabinan endo-1,5-alpha-L-arabinosidase
MRLDPRAWSPGILSVAFTVLLAAAAAFATPAAPSAPPRVHDPSIVREGTTWWVFGTGKGAEVMRSTDRQTWTRMAPLFDAEKPWWREYAAAMKPDDIWAPDVHFFRGRYWLYYSVSEFGKNNSAIGLISCDRLAAEHWRDDGFVIGSKAGVQAYNAIDPFLAIDADGVPWLVFGSWFDGIQLVRLDPATMKPVGAVRVLARRDGGIEAANVVRANGYYYLFVSIDRCCAGVNSTYKIAYGRAKDIGGPFLARDGQPMLAGAATVLMAGGGRWIGPGGQTVYHDGDHWIMVYHAYDADDHGAPKLQISELKWDADGWPVN